MSQNPTWHRRIPTINAERGYHSRLLEKLLQSTKALVNFLLKGPSTNAVRNKVRFYVTTPTSLMIQPGLCAHTVITLSEGPAIVAGFEAKLVEDDLRQRQVLNHYSPGMRKETKFLAVQTCTYTTLSNYLRDTGRSRTELGQHVECFKVDGKIFGGARKVENHGIKEEQIISRECKRRLHACKNWKKLRECSWVLCLYWSQRYAVFHPTFVSINCMLQCVITGWEQAAMSEIKKKR